MNMKQTGLTLVELMVTLAVVSTLLAVGIPQFKNTTANSRLTSGINTLSGDFSFARTEAIKRGVPVTVTITGGGSDWATNGWTVAAGAINLRVSPELATSNTIVTVPANTTSVTFNPDGRSAATVAVAFTLCDDRGGNSGKRITLNSTGQTFLDINQDC
jgi:type IV fimbrial biogenesis protein FimT